MEFLRHPAEHVILNRQDPFARQHLIHKISPIITDLREYVSRCLTLYGMVLSFVPVLILDNYNGSERRRSRRKLAQHSHITSHPQLHQGPFTPITERDYKQHMLYSVREVLCAINVFCYNALR